MDTKSNRGGDTKWRELIEIHSQMCPGMPRVKSTRQRYSMILDSIAAGESIASIEQDYEVERADIQDALLCAADLARDRIIAVM